MADANRLHLYEEVMLLALHDKKGTLATGFANIAVAGALVAEMLLEGRIAIEEGRRKLVDVVSRAPFGDPILDEALARIADSKRRAPARAWLMRLANAKRLHHRVAQQLCRRSILRADEDTVLLFFRRKTYPELNPLPERRLIEKMRNAIVARTGPIEPRTVVLISLANGADLLKKALGRDTVKERKDRIKEIVRGDVIGKATKEAIAACESAVFVAAVIPAAAAAAAASR